MADVGPSGVGRRRRIWLKVVGAVVAALLLGAGFIGAGNAYVLSTTRARIYADLDATPPAPVAIVLGTQVLDSQEPSIQLVDRLVAAVELYRAGKVDRILVSGATRGAYDEAGAMSAWLAARGVPRSALFLDRQGFRTMATMVRAARVFDVREAIVCTQLYHLPRALVLARKAGLSAVGLATDRQWYPDQWIHYTTREGIARPTMLIESIIPGMRAEGLDRRIPITGDSEPSWKR